MPKIRGVKPSSGNSTSPAFSLDKEESDTCITCNKLITGDAFECVWCRKWQHRVCINLSVGKYGALSDLPNNIVFFCSHCFYKLPNALMAYDNTKEVCDVIETKLNSVQMDLLNRFEDLTEKVNNLVSYSEQEPDTAVVENTEPSEQVIHTNEVTVESIASMTAAIISEEKEREKRKLNLIVHNLPESTSAEASIRKSEDTQNVTSLFNKYIGVNAHISNVTRIGKQTGRPRLTKVTLSTREEKFKILHNRLNLRKKEHPTYVTKVFITPDLTPQEHIRNKQLHAWLSELNKQDKLYRIKNGKIVLREAS